MIEEDVAEVEVAVDEILLLGLLDVGVVGVDVVVVMLIVELLKKVRKRVFDLGGSVFEINAGQLLDKLGYVVGGASESGVGKVVDAVAEGVTLDFLMDGKGAFLGVIAELHLGGVKASFAIDKVANGSVFDDHFGPERIAREAEEVIAVVGGDFDDDVGPAGEDVVGLEDFFVGQSLGDDLVEIVFGSKKFSHTVIIP